MMRPLPPFRAKPAHKPSPPKQASESRKKDVMVVVKARRHPIKVARLTTAPALKVLAHAGGAHA